MADEPTIEEVAAAKALLQTASQADLAGSPFEALVANIRTLLASHASLEESVKEAKRLMKPFAAVSLPKEWGDKDGVHIFGDKGGAGWMKVGDIRALAAFVNEKERTDG